MKKEELRGKSSIKYKFPMFILVIGYLIFFIYTFITKDYDLKNKYNILKLIFVFISIFLMGCSAISNSKRTIFYTITNYLIIIGLIGTSIYSLVPKESKTNTNVEKNIICTGSTDTSDNTKIDVTYKDDSIKKIVYTYTFDLKNKTGAENLVNRFDKLFSDYGSIYSEITISDNVVVKFTYYLDKVDINKVKELNQEITNSYKELKDKELKNLTCKEQ